MLDKPSPCLQCLSSRLKCIRIFCPTQQSESEHPADRVTRIGMHRAIGPWIDPPSFAAPAGSTPRTFAELREGMCRWPQSPADNPDIALFCAAPVIDAGRQRSAGRRSYCAEHAALAYRTAQPWRCESRARDLERLARVVR